MTVYGANAPATNNEPIVTEKMWARALNKSRLALNMPKDRNQKLLQQGIGGFFHAIQKRNRLQNPKTPRNRWFLWKDR